MPKLMNSVISAQIKNDHAFFRRVSEIGGDFISYKDIPLGLTVFISLIYYYSKAADSAQLIPVHRRWFPLVLLVFF